MAHPVYWSNKTYLYAIGNTPAVCFTADLPPEQPGDVLLLGCGDARSVLYTVFADLGAHHARRLDFTCCDIEPAILARNVLLYTLLMELKNVEDTAVTIPKIWNFYYHVFIDDDTLDMLTAQCRRLADLSADLSSWNNSKYGTFLRFCARDTLSELRRYWLLYSQMKNVAKTERDALRKEFLSGNHWLKRGLNLTSVRASGPFILELGDLGDQHFKHYWSTGVTFTDPAKITSAIHVNPTFVYSSMGKGIVLHYGADPILSFHLAECLAPLKDETPRTDPNISTLVDCAMGQFESWCQAFSKRLMEIPSSLVIRFFAGDSLGFCRALRYCALTRSFDTPVYTRPWSTSLITLDGSDYLAASQFSAPLKFDVIDNSNLRDHIGLVNVLVTTIPLLRRKSSSTIYTDSLHASKDEKTTQHGLLAELLGDPTTMFLLLDLCPVSYVSNFTTHSNIHERIANSSAAEVKQCLEHVSWKIPSLANTETTEMDEISEPRLKFDPIQLARFLMGVYLQMFWEERDPRSLLAQNVTKDVFRRLTLFHYVRTSFVALLQIIKDKVDIAWTELMLSLHDLITNDDSLLLGSNSFQDLFCALSVSGVHTLDPLLPGASDSMARGDDAFPSKGWRVVPPIVCITFKVPRSKLKPIEHLSPDEIGNPVLVCNLMSVMAHNYFHDFMSFFGDVKVESSGSDNCMQSITFEEDALGVRGSSPLIFSFYIPSWIIRQNASKINVALSIRSTIAVPAQVRQVLGNTMVLFSKPLMDSKYVFITHERPGNVGELEKLRNLCSGIRVQSISDPVVEGLRLTLDQACRSTMQLTRRVNVRDESAKAALLDKAPVEIKQISPQALEVMFGSHCQIIPFPLPVDSTDVKTRIARKSSYFEVDVMPSGPLQKLGMTINHFPIVNNGNQLTVWNIHYLNLEHLPALDVSLKDKLLFLQPHVLLAYSDRELKLTKDHGQRHLNDRDLGSILCIKQTIYQLFIQTCGLKPGLAYQRIYGLTDPDNDKFTWGLYCVILIDGIRLDLASHTVVLDAYVIPTMTSEVEAMLESFGQIMKVITKSDEARAWKQLLPAFVERCRIWSHSDACEYRTKGVPVSFDAAESPLCSCGTGKNIGSLVQNKAWKRFAPFVTRAAISALFAVPFVETIGGDLLRFMSGQGTGRGAKGTMKAVCAKCEGPGRPKLLLCGRCGNVSYCSLECQKVHWKLHRKLCQR